MAVPHYHPTDIWIPLPPMSVCFLNQDLMKGYILHLAVMALLSFNLDSTSLILEHECRSCNIFLFSSLAVQCWKRIGWLLWRVSSQTCLLSVMVQVIANFGNNPTWLRHVCTLLILNHISTHVVSSH